MDYRELNNLMVPNHFPMLIINKLLDKSHGAVVCSKLNLKSRYLQISIRKTGRAFSDMRGPLQILDLAL